MREESKKLRYVVYLRKSTDSEDRQIQSVDDQWKALKPIIDQHHLKVVKIFRESQSAKSPGRPFFNEMVQMIESGRSNGIICWRPNRLSRNPVDGGLLQWMLQQNKIQSLLTPAKEYLPSDSVLILGVEFGVANQFSIDLGRDVARGMASKASKGWKPTKPPIGYLPDRGGEKGEKQVIVDQVRFPIVRKMWDAMLTGMFSIRQVINKANDEWGLRTRATKKVKSDKLSYSGGYKIFTNLFYTGDFWYKGELHHGKHQPMITKPEFDLVQRILSKTGKAKPHTKLLPFNGIIQCGECGAMVTAEEKNKFRKDIGKVATYLYHHCTKKKKGVSCGQKSIKHEDLVEQIKVYLDSIAIPEEFLHWAIQVLRDNSQLEESNRKIILDNHHKNYDSCLTRIKNLLDMYISPENARRELLTDEEYKAQKNALIIEKTHIENQMREVESGVDHWLDLSEKTFHFATYAKVWFEKGDFQQKTQILAALGQNFTLTNGNLDIQLAKPFLTLKEGLVAEDLQKLLSELRESILDKRKNSPVRAEFSHWSG